MADLHTCTCDHGHDDSPDGCNATPWRDVCRFEQALADPVDAQVDAAARSLAVASGDSMESCQTLAREMLAAAAAVVLGRAPCTSCGRPLGTGTLLDRSPIAWTPGPPGVDAVMDEWAAIVPPRGPAGITRGLWEAFAVKYRCPACADHDARSAAALGYVTDLVAEHRKAPDGG